MKTFWNTQGGLSQLTEWQPNCWIQVTCPTEEDQHELEEKFNIPDYFMSDISDTDERARYEYDDGWMLINFTFTFHFHALEKEMATHSSVLALRIPGWGSLVGCRLWGRTESDTTEAT